MVIELNANRKQAAKTVGCAVRTTMPSDTGPHATPGGVGN